MNPLAANLAGASILLVLVLAIRGPVARAFGPHAAFALWLAPALRLILPPLPTFPAFDEPTSEAASWAVVIEPITNAAPAGVDWFALWLLGALAVLAYHIVRHGLFLHRALASGRAHRFEGVDCDAVFTNAVDGPAATGLFHRLVLLPDDFETRFTPEQQRLALLHECLHHRRGDLWASTAALLGAAALWFNPFAYVALGAFRRDMEAACDATLLAQPGRASPRVYGETILRSAARPVPRSLCALTSVDELKGRLTMLDRTHSPTRRTTGILLALGLAATGLAFGAPALADEPKTEKRIEKRIIETTDGKHADWTNKSGEHVMHECPGELTTVEADSAGSGNKKEVAKIAICSKGGNKAEAAKGLERALAEIGKDGDMDPAVKASLTAKLQAKIAELRAGQ